MQYCLVQALWNLNILETTFIYNNKSHVLFRQSLHNLYLVITVYTCPQILLACLAAVAIAQNPEGAAELRLDERVDQGDGNFAYTFETSNGIFTETRGTPGAVGQSNMVGSYR